jgi:hypothetical protein
MRRLRFSIANLLILVLFVAVAIAALREATDLWDRGVFSLTLGLLLVAVLLAAHRADRRRVYWMGFALFGSAYLGASLVPPIESRLLSTKGLAYLDSKVVGRNQYLLGEFVVTDGHGVGAVTADLNVDGNADIYVASATDPHFLMAGREPQTSTNRRVISLWDAGTGKLLYTSGGTSENFTRIGHSLLALVLAFVGGHISRSLFDRETRQRGERPADSSMAFEEVP